MTKSRLAVTEVWMLKAVFAVRCIDLEHLGSDPRSALTVVLGWPNADNECAAFSEVMIFFSLQQVNAFLDFHVDEAGEIDFDSLNAVRSYCLSLEDDELPPMSDQISQAVSCGTLLGHLLAEVLVNDADLLDYCATVQETVVDVVDDYNIPPRAAVILLDAVGLPVDEDQHQDGPVIVGTKKFTHKN